MTALLAVEFDCLRMLFVAALVDTSVEQYVGFEFSLSDQNFLRVVRIRRLEDETAATLLTQQVEKFAAFMT